MCRVTQWKVVTNVYNQNIKLAKKNWLSTMYERFI